MTVQAISKQGKKRKQNFSSAECALLVELLEKNGYKLCICDSFKLFFSLQLLLLQFVYLVRRSVMELLTKLWLMMDGVESRLVKISQVTCCNAN